MAKAKILGDIRKIDRDVELCRTTNRVADNAAAKLLLETGIPFSRDFIKIPFFKRKKYSGASRFYVIRTNRNRYGQARRAIDMMDIQRKQKLIFI